MQFKVPQNIDIQDRILGPLTMVQFIYAVVGGGICYGIFNAVPKPFSFFLIVPIALFALALIFLKINERPFLDFLISALEYARSPKKRVWHHENMPDLNLELYKPKEINNHPAAQAKTISHEDIQNAARKLDKIN